MRYRRIFKTISHRRLYHFLENAVGINKCINKELLSQFILFILTLSLISHEPACNFSFEVWRLGVFEKVFMRRVGVLVMNTLLLIVSICKKYLHVYILNLAILIYIYNLLDQVFRYYLTIHSFGVVYQYKLSLLMYVFKIYL